MTRSKWGHPSFPYTEMRSVPVRRNGFVLLPVVLLIAVIATVIFLLTRENASSLSIGASEAETTKALYVAEAGFQHALSQAQQANCSNYASLTNQAFGDHSYSVAVTPTDGSPVTFQSTAALASGANMTIQRSATTVYSAASTQSVVLQPGSEGDDAEIWDQEPNNNYGDSGETWVSSASNDTTRSLLRFNMATIPERAIVLGATLSLLRQSGSGADQPVSAHRITKSWSEDSVTWNSRDSGTNWDTAGGDFDNNAVATTPVGPVDQRYEWNITPLAQGWVDGSYPNYGIALIAAIDGMSGERFYTSDESNLDRRPSLIVTYACECGQICVGGGAAGNLLLIVGDATTLSTKDVGYQTLIESWGYTVSVIDDGASQADYDTAMAAADVIYASGSALGANMLDKATNTTKGLVNEVNGKIDNFGFSSSTSATSNFDTFSATHSAHYITEPFSGSAVTVFTSSLTNPIPGGTLAPDLQNVGEVSGTPSLVTLDTGATGWNGNPVPARRAHLPFTSAETTDMTADGKTILRRALEWAAGAVGGGGGGPKKVLFVVGNDGGLTTEELAHQAQLEDWGHTVEVIDDDASPAEFDVAAASNDVAYTTNDITASRLGTKLVDATIGVISSEDNLSDEFGMASSIGWESGTVVEINDNTHYITSPFATGLLTVFSGSESLAYVSGTLSPDLGQLASSSSGYGIVTLEAGAAMYGGGMAAGRRVQLPWGGSPSLEPNDLTADGLTILKRAIEWGAGAGNVSTFETRIAAGNDDAEQRIGDGYVDNSSTDLELAYDIDGSNTDLVGMRFIGVAVPQGAAISNAYIQFQADELKSSITSLSINGQNTDNAVAFTTTDFDISSRAPTAASVPWLVPLWNAVGDAGPDQRTPNIASVIQEIVDRPGWSSGNALVVMVTGTGTRTAEAYEGDPSGAPLLHIEYDGGGGEGGGGPPGYLDEFNSRNCSAADYAGTDGAVDWSPWAWTEIDELDGSCAGQIRVASDPDIDDSGSFRLRVTSQGVRVYRSVDLTGFSQPTLSFDYRLTDYPALDFMRIRVFDGVGYIEIGRFTGPFDQTAYQSASFDLSAYAGLEIQVQFEFNGTSTTRTSYIDNVHVFDGGGGGGGGGTFRDEFNAQGYAGSDGTLTWATVWLENGESDGPTKGKVSVLNDISNFQLELKDKNRGVEREADLSGHASATMTFDYRRDSLDNAADYLAVEVSSNGGSTWTEIGRLVGPATDSSYQGASYDISAHIAASTRIRLLTSDSNGKSDLFYIDNVEITVN